MAQIRQGGNLKKANNQNRPPPLPVKKEETMANTLSDALAANRKFLLDSDSEESDDSDWDDSD